MQLDVVDVVYRITLTNKKFYKRTMAAQRVSVLFLLGTVTTVSAFQITSVETKIGTINGKVENVTWFGETFKIHKYFGIPFAEPPVGELRFKKPVPKSSLNKPLDAFNHSHACHQVTIYKLGNVSTDEDCLYLNIYAPERQSENEKLAVMVWIYGGSFMHGFSDIYVADNLATYGNVIIVTFNYRISVWGFLSTGDEYAPGNYGLWDQHMAIKWVHDNIAVFGGDTERITVFGESAGSASVIFQTLYPGNKGLFQRAIAQSGSIGAFWSINKNNPQNAQHLGSLAKCDTRNNEALIACLRDVPAQKLEEFVSEFSYGLLTFPSPFAPYIDGEFINYDQEHAFDSDNTLPKDSQDIFAAIDLMTGVISKEGSVFVLPMFGVMDPEHFLPNRTFFEEELVPIFLNTLYGEPVPRSVRASTTVEYTKWSNPDNEYNIRDEFVSMWGDGTFVAGLFRTLNKHATLSSNLNNTYMYYFDEEPDFTGGFAPMTWFKKLGHGEDIPFLFGFLHSGVTKEEFNVIPSPWEETLSRDFIRLWTNFAKTGNPNLPDDMNINWVAYTKTSQHYLHLSRNMTSANVKQYWNQRRAKFWTSLVPELMKTTCISAASCQRSLTSALIFLFILLKTLMLY
ncbi:cholinesterase 1-like [Mercenaria mercenaria]|uniref:cholinesterase 1-like n=1 Tax=Mercenaria mercenaria TaxID=6596 RepID=UPI00234E6B80|nr:cholinesterase 1-like [Mercenaria mercenaria]